MFFVVLQNRNMECKVHELHPYKKRLYSETQKCKGSEWKALQDLKIQHSPATAVFQEGRRYSLEGPIKLGASD